MANLSTPHSPVTTLATMNHASNAITLAIFASTAGGTSVLFVKSAALATLNAVALWAVLVLAPLHPRPRPPLNLAPFLLPVLGEWSPSTLAFVVTTRTPAPLLVLVPLSKTLITTMSPSPT